MLFESKECAYHYKKMHTQCKDIGTMSAVCVDTEIKNDAELRRDCDNREGE